MAGRDPGALGTEELGQGMQSIMDFRGRTPTKIGMEWGGGDIPAISAINVRDGYLDLSRGVNYGSEALHDRWMSQGPTRVGDVVFTTEAPLGNVALLSDDKKYILSQRVVLLRPSWEQTRSEYLRYFLSSSVFRQGVESRATGSTAEGVKRRYLMAMPSCALPTGEQRHIAAFLDRETARIDALVAKKERLIELLQEKRTALITRAVTKGLDPNVPMKDSGVEWLGEIPAHWEVKRLKEVVPAITVGIVVTPSKYYVDEGVPCLRSLNIAHGEVSMTDLVFISPSANDLHRKSKIFEGDVLVIRTGKAGAAVVVPSKLNGANCIDLLIVRRSTMTDSRFLYHFINSPATLGQVEAHSVGAIQEHYNTGTLAKLCLPGIPVVEQRAIAAFLDGETAKLDALTAKVRDAIDRLKELRTALISAAVTGKIDVREEVA